MFKDRKQIEAGAGMIASLIFVSAFAIEGLLRTGYNPQSMYVSELSLGPRGWIQVLNFIITGILLNLFTNHVIEEFRNGKAGPVLLRIIAVSLLVSGPFLMDPANTPRDQMSWHGILHGIFGALVFTLSPITCFIFYKKFKTLPKWKSLKNWTLIIGILISFAVVLLSYVTKTSAVSSPLNNLRGFIQRMVLIPFFLWIFIFSYKLYKSPKGETESINSGEGTGV